MNTNQIPDVVTIRVVGVPAPGGSKNAIPFRRANGLLGANLVESSKRAAPWRRMVTIAALEAMAGKFMFFGPVEMEIEFIMPRPNAHLNSRGLLHPWAKEAHHMKAPDATKLTRSTEDALKSVVWKDDSQVVKQTISKRFRNTDERPGARIIVRPAVAAEGK